MLQKGKFRFLNLIYAEINFKSSGDITQRDYINNYILQIILAMQTHISIKIITRCYWTLDKGYSNLRKHLKY